MTDELLSCPFCGSDPMPDFCSSNDGPAYSFHCQHRDCPAWPNVQGDTEAEAIAAWNTRQPAAKPDQVEAVADDADMLDEIAEAISDTLDLDWQPSWAAPNILALIKREKVAAIAAMQPAPGVTDAMVELGAKAIHQEGCFEAGCSPAPASKQP